MWMNPLVAWLLLLLSSHASSFVSLHSFDGHHLALKMSTANQQREIDVVVQPDTEFLTKKGVFGWGTWGCGVSEFPWTYSESESCYLLAGKVTVTPTDGRQPVTFGKGDFVTFPAGLSCRWDVTEAVEKHYMFF